MKQTFVVSWAVLLGAFVAGCSTIRTSSIPTIGGAAPAYAGVVTLVATQLPQGATEVGIIQATANKEEISQVAEAFKGEAARLGANVAKLDRIFVTYEMVTTTQMQGYSCGTQNAPRTCYRSVPVTTEVATTNMIGRAFRTAEVAR